MIRTVGELKKLLQNLPDNLPVGGYPSGNRPDYGPVSFYVHDRKDEPNVLTDPEAIKYWKGPVPVKILVCNTD